MPLSNTGKVLRDRLASQKIEAARKVLEEEERQARIESAGNPMSAMTRVAETQIDSLETFGRAFLQAAIEAYEAESAFMTDLDAAELKAEVCSLVNGRARSLESEFQRKAEIVGSSHHPYSQRLASAQSSVTSTLVNELEIYRLKKQSATGVGRMNSSTDSHLETKVSPASEWTFDVAISFAAGQRTIAQELAALARDAGIRVFYDYDHQADLWGQDLTLKLDEIYRVKARYCLPLVSREYAERQWPRLELRSARARAMAERDAYILPLRVEDDVELEGVPGTIGYVSLSTHSLAHVVQLLVKKLGRVALRSEDRIQPAGPDRGDVTFSKRIGVLSSQRADIAVGYEVFEFQAALLGKTWDEDLSVITFRELYRRGQHYLVYEEHNHRGDWSTASLHGLAEDGGLLTLEDVHARFSALATACGLPRARRV